MLRSAFALVVLAFSSLPLSAQSLNQAAGRERDRRTIAVASPSRVFTGEDLRRYAAQRPPETASPLPSDQPPESIGAPSPAMRPRQDAYGRHWTSAEAYVRQCEQRLRAAQESWLAASDAGQKGAATRVRREVENAARSLERAREYCSQAEVTARLARPPLAGPL